MNCLALEQRGEVLLIDCGVTFDNRGLGIDVVHADFRVLDEYLSDGSRSRTAGGATSRSARVVGVFITHGHEDHIGALPYLLKRFDVPVYGPPYALGLVKNRAHEHDILAHARFIETRPGEVYEVGSFLVEPVRVTHSIADATALAITTDAGTVIHTGDFKIDDAPPDGEDFDEARFRALGDAGVELLFSDSTNIDAQGPTGSESGVGEVLEKLVTEADQAVIVGLFASNVHRLKMLGAIAKKTGRKIVPLGRSVNTHSRVAHATGYLNWPSDLVCAPERARDLPRNKVLGLATGTQAEGNAALARLARNEHPNYDLHAGDTVILSSRVIPGNEPQAYVLMGDLLRRGAIMKTWASDRGVHVSGHAHRQDQRKMLELVRPRAFVPAHGTLHHLTRHAALATEMGVGEICLLENGDIAELTKEAFSKVDRMVVPRVYVHMGREIPRSVVKDRQALAAEGVVFVVVTIDAKGKLVGDPLVLSRGVVDSVEGRDLLEAAQLEVKQAIGGLSKAAANDEAAIESAAKLTARRVIGRAVGYKPTTIATVRRQVPAAPQTGNEGG